MTNDTDAPFKCRDCNDPIDATRARDYGYRCASCTQAEMRGEGDALADQIEEDWPE